MKLEVVAGWDSVPEEGRDSQEGDHAERNRSRNGSFEHGSGCNSIASEKFIENLPRRNKGNGAVGYAEANEVEQTAGGWTAPETGCWSGLRFFLVEELGREGRRALLAYVSRIPLAVQIFQELRLFKSVSGSEQLE